MASSSTTPKFIYDVFLSFRGEDVRKNFVDHLYTSLEQKGIYTFKDDEKLERGKSISPELLKAIEESRMAVIIFSENYASSSWCLDELAKIIECMEVFGQTVLPIFYHVDPSAVRKQKDDDSYGKALKKHEGLLVEEKERVKGWRRALSEASSISGWNVENIADGHEAKFIQQIADDLMKKLNSTLPASDTDDLVGIESQVQKLDSLLGKAQGFHQDVRYVGIWGMSGIGKTTLARVVYDRISSYFEAGIFISEVREGVKKHGLERLQEKLLSKLLNVRELKIDNVFEGMNMARRRLCHKKVVIVLDDVDHQEQLDALAGKHAWFGIGSRIIITTRNKHLLVRNNVDRMYRVKALDNDEAIKLFMLYSFRNDHPKIQDYEQLSAQVVSYASGLPLALKVLGSSLYGRDVTEWRSSLERLKLLPEDEILEKLKVSFNGLKKIEKEIFLDIACFFKGKKKDSVTQILDSFNFYPGIGIRVLIEKSLITVSRGRLLMHQLIQEMGWHIVREGTANEPGMRSRLWLAEDIHHVLTKNMGTSSIEGLLLHLATPVDVNFRNNVFKSMDKLRLLIVHNALIPNAPDYFPSELKWLDWYGYPSKSLPTSFQAENLVCLKMKYSRIIQIWKGVKVVDKLKFINLSHSQKLIRTPDFTGIPNLERLILEDCASLVEIHPSVGLLKRLVLCNLKDCINLRKLAKSMTLERLEVFILSGCLKLDTFPEIIGSMKYLLEIRMEATAVTELPWSIGNLTNLCLLNLSCCRVLESLPDSLTKMKCLKILVLSGCSRFNSLPEEIGQMESLEELHCDETAILQPPSSISLLKNLKSLSFRGCREVNSERWSSNLVSWPFSRKYLNAKKYFNFPSVSGLHSLTKLDLSDCSMLEGGVPNDINCLISLEELNLGMNNFVNISAASLSGLARLRVLELNGCERLEALPELPLSIAEVYADDCTSLKSSADALIKYKNMYRMSFSNCINFLQDQQDSDIPDRLWHHLLKGLSSTDDNFSICLPGAIVPDWFQHQNIGPSISVTLPPNWYNDKFMGFGLCVVSDLLSTSLSRSYNYLTKIPGIRIQFTVKTKDLKRSRYATNICNIGADKDVDSEHMILAYVPFGKLWVAFHKRVHSPNDWISIEASADDLSKNYFVLKAWGFRLVYEDDVKHMQTDDDCSSIIQQSSPDLRKMGLFHATFSGFKYIKEGRNGDNYNFSRLPPEI